MKPLMIRSAVRLKRRRKEERGRREEFKDVMLPALRQTPIGYGVASSLSRGEILRLEMGRSDILAALAERKKRERVLLSLDLNTYVHSQ